MLIVTIALLVLGIAILVFGADVMVRGAGSLSKKAGIPPIVIGLTVVAFGTSAPELVVNIFSALQGTTDLALGNVVGSNISNILLILGVSALIMNLKVQRTTTWKEIPFAALSVLMLFIMASDVFFDKSPANVISATDGLSLLGFFLIFLYYTFQIFLNRDKGAKEDEKIQTYSYPMSFVYTIGGFLLLIGGGKLLVTEAIILANLAGMSEMLIGLTVVAVGTSLPELATSIIAVRKGQTDIAIGNAVGSNIFNTLWILGVTATISPIPVAASGYIDILICLGVTLALFFALFVGKKHTLQRWQGAVFVAGYIAYTVYLVWRG